MTKFAPLLGQKLHGEVWLRQTNLFWNS